jgi:hypothetical protein
MGDSDPQTRVLLEKLANVAADLLSERRYTPFLRGLLSVERGTWRLVCELCGGMQTLPADAPAAFEACGDRLHVRGCFALWAARGEKAAMAGES